MDATQPLVRRYRLKMSKELPKRDDDALFRCHKRTVESVMNHFDPAKLIKDVLSPNKMKQRSGPSIKEALGNAFMNIIDENWRKCEDICCEALDRAKSKVFHAEAEVRSENYWALVERVNAEYNDDIGESLCSKMVFKRLEHLDSRQDADFKILMEEMQRQASEASANVDVESGTSAAGTDGEVISDAPTSASIAGVSNSGEAIQTESLVTESRTIEKQLEMELKLRMTWGRILIFWRYWSDCRKESIELLRNMSVTFEEKRLDGKTDTVDVCLEVIKRHYGLGDFPLRFAHIVNKDLSCYKVLLRKLTEFLELVKSSEFLDAFDVDPKDLFFSVSTFKTSIFVRQSEICSGFEISENLIIREKERLGAIEKLLACPLQSMLHLKDLLRKLSDEDKLNQAGIEGVINDLEEEENEVSNMFPESLMSFLEVSCKVNAAAEQLRKDIEVWLPKRTESISKLKEIIEKLNKTSRDVAITQTVSSSVGIVGGIIAIVGLVFAPFTFGASLVPTAIAAGVVSGLGAATAIGAAVTEIVIDKEEMEKATICIKEDKALFEEVAKRIDNLNRNSTRVLKYIPKDELESFITTMTVPKSIALRSSSSQIPRIAINTARFGSFLGKAAVMPVTRLAYSGAHAVLRGVLLPLAHGVAIIGVGLDIANLVLASVKLGKDAKSENAEKLEDAVKQMEVEKGKMENYFPKMR